jgi:hypothetical protein
MAADRKELCRPVACVDVEAVDGHVAAELPSTCPNVPWAMSSESPHAPYLLPSPEGCDRAVEIIGAAH